MSALPPRPARPHVLVTGAAAGLGAGIVQRLAGIGYRLTLTHRAGVGTTAPAQTLACARHFDPTVRSFAVDFAQRSQSVALLAELAREVPPIDILVHAAGPFEIARFATATTVDYDVLLEANLGSAVCLASGLLPGMRARRFGRLVFFGMTGASITRPARGLSLYGAAKAGLTSFARALSLEEAQSGITVNVIEPGDIRNKVQDRTAARATVAKNPSGRAGSWEDIASAVEFLIAPQNDFINGAVLAVGGGLVDAGE